MGFTENGKLHIGDNSGVKVYCFPLRKIPDLIAEKSISVRGLQECTEKNWNHKEIYDIAEGKKEGSSSQTNLCLIGKNDRKYN